MFNFNLTSALFGSVASTREYSATATSQFLFFRACSAFRKDLLVVQLLINATAMMSRHKNFKQMLFGNHFIVKAVNDFLISLFNNVPFDLQAWSQFSGFYCKLLLQ